MEWVALIRVYREMVAEMLHSATSGPTRSQAPCQSGAFAEPVLALFPKLVADPAMIKALCSHWYQQKNAMKAAGGLTNSQWKDPKKIRDAFYYTVNRLWLASSAKSSQLPIGRVGETYEQVEKRAESIKSIFFTSGIDVLRPMHIEGEDDRLFSPFNTREVAFEFNP